LVISDAHQGLPHAIQTVFQGVMWQRCRVHCLRNLLSLVPRSAQAMGAALVRTIFAQATQDDARQQLQAVSEQLRPRFPAAAALLDAPTEDVLASRAFPMEHGRPRHSTNPLERLNRELARRCDVVGIFPNPAAVLRLAGAVLLDQQDEWGTAPRRYFSQTSMEKLQPRYQTALTAAHGAR
jgi:putative transposase